MDITLLSFDVSHNCLGRACMLAEILSRRFEVEIVGPASRPEGVWLPARDCGIPVRWFYAGAKTGPAAMRRLLEMPGGDLLYAIKPRATSFGAGLLIRHRRHLPLVVDVDDWELGFYRHNLWPALRAEAKNIANVNNMASTWLMENMVSKADAVTTSSSFLNRRFGGVMVPHCRDTARMDPALFAGQRERVRREHGWSEDVVTMFLGTPGPHKGIDTLLAASRILRDLPLKTVIAGVPRSSSLHDQYRLDARVEILSELPLAEAPGLLAAADIVVVPQLEGPASTGQVPAKLIDAMAMGKAIVASGVSDIPEILDGCGLIAAPGDAADLAAGIRHLAGDESLRQTLGGQARDRCLAKYSYDAMEDRLASLFMRVNDRGRGLN